MSRMFEHGKVYRFMPIKTGSFLVSIWDKDTEYNSLCMWQLEIGKNVFMYKGSNAKESLVINGYLVKRSWCEEVK